MDRNKLIEIIVEKLLLAVVASVVLLLFKYYVEIQQSVDEQIFQQGISVRDAVGPVNSSRDIMIKSIGAISDAIDSHGVTQSTSEFRKTLTGTRSDLEDNIRILKGLKAALGATNDKATAENGTVVDGLDFGTKTLELLGAMTREITRIINLPDDEVESNLVQFERFANDSAELMYSSTAQDLIDGSRIAMRAATSEFRSTVTTSLWQMIKPLFLILVVVFIVAIILWRVRAEAPESGRQPPP